MSPPRAAHSSLLVLPCSSANIRWRRGFRSPEAPCAYHRRPAASPLLPCVVLWGIQITGGRQLLRSLYMQAWGLHGIGGKVDQHF